MSKRIVFMGTPEFAVRSLELILNAGIEVAAVVTVPDKPAGRGQQVSESAVKKFAAEKKLPLLQPEKLKDENFLSELKKLNADLFVVVAFRMLPEQVWMMPPYGTINLHASLLPQYRGAAPINWAVINGDKETGATTFFIETEIDTGKIIDQVKISIGDDDNAGMVHDHLMEAGAELLVKTIGAIFAEETNPKTQAEFSNNELKSAPKIFKEDCFLNWTDTALNLHNKIRGLSPYPAAWTFLYKEDQKKSVKVFKTSLGAATTDNTIMGTIKVDQGKLYFGCADAWLQVHELQLEGKKRMSSQEFLNGFNPQGWTLKN